VFERLLIRAVTNAQKAISPVPPQFYGERFLKFMISIIRGNSSTEEQLEEKEKKKEE